MSDEAGVMVRAGQPMLLDRLEDQPQDSLIALIALASSRSAAGQDRRRRRRLSRQRRQHPDPEMRQGGRAAAASRARRPRPISARRATPRFVELIRPIVFGAGAADDERIVGLQTPGGCGALRLGAELVARANPEARIFAGEPTWPNHAPLIASAGVEMVAYPYYDKDEHDAAISTG